MEHLLTIGVFGRRCGLSSSALRFYDQCGLLRPVAVDDSTGYRYYSADQVPQAELVRRLREAEMPMAAVSRFLGADLSERLALLDEHAATLEERAGSLRRAVSEVRSRLGGAGDQERPWGCVLPAGRLAGAFDDVRFAVGGDDRPELAVVWVETRDDRVRVVATDSFRLVVRDVPPSELTRGAAIRAALPMAVVDELSSTLTTSHGPVALRQVAHSGLEADIDGTVVRLRVAETGFPDYEALLAGLPGGHRGVADRRSLVAVVTSTPGPTATLTFGADGLQVLGGGRDQLVGGSWDGPGLSITVNPLFVSEALAALVGPDVIIEASDALRPIVLRSADDGALSVWTMPIRPSP